MEDILKEKRTAGGEEERFSTSTQPQDGGEEGEERSIQIRSSFPVIQAERERYREREGEEGELEREVQRERGGGGRARERRTVAGGAARESRRKQSFIHCPCVSHCRSHSLSPLSFSPTPSHSSPRPSPSLTPALPRFFKAQAKSDRAAGRSS